MTKNMTVDVAFEDNMRIAARMGGQTIDTGQPVKDGGDGLAPSPFDLFVASLATCAGVYARRFLEARKLSERGLGLSLECRFHEQRFQIVQMRYLLTLPEGFPEKLTDALVRSIDLCTVKKHVTDPPQFSIEVR